MKARLFRRTLLMLATAAVTLTACNNNDDPFYANSTTALVTVRPVGGGSFTMQLDHATALAPANLSQSPFGSKEVRALVNYTPVESERSNMRMVNVNWIDSIRTKMPVRDMGAQNDRLYGNDPVEIVRDWVTVAEDGYLTLRIRTLWGNRGIKHHINLLTGGNANDVYEVELRHNAMGDTRSRQGDAMIAFNLNDLPRNGQEEVRVKLRWTSFSGPKSAEFNLQLHPTASAHQVDRATMSSMVD